MNLPPCGGHAPAGAEGGRASSAILKHGAYNGFSALRRTRAGRVAFTLLIRTVVEMPEEVDDVFIPE